MDQIKYKKCKKCEEDWPEVKLLDNGECIDCNPGYLIPKKKAKEDPVVRRKEGPGNPDYFNK